jgi:hypothetical protein
MFSGRNKKRQEMLPFIDKTLATHIPALTFDCGVFCTFGIFASVTSRQNRMTPFRKKIAQIKLFNHIISHCQSAANILICALPVMLATSTAPDKSNHD